MTGSSDAIDSHTADDDGSQPLSDDSEADEDEDWRRFSRFDTIDDDADGLRFPALRREEGGCGDGDGEEARENAEGEERGEGTADSSERRGVAGDRGGRKMGVQGLCSVEVGNADDEDGEAAGPSPAPMRERTEG